MRILVNSHLIFKARSKFLRLFLKLIDRYLSHKHGEILHLRLTALIAHGDVGLVRKSEFLILTHVIDVCASVFLDSLLTCLLLP